MEDFECFSLRCKSGVLELLDQTLLPDVEEWLPCAEPAAMHALIVRLAVRGAPAIGVAAAYCCAAEALKSQSGTRVREVADYLETARPVSSVSISDVQLRTSCRLFIVCVCFKKNNIYFAR